MPTLPTPDAIRIKQGNPSKRPLSRSASLVINNSKSSKPSCPAYLDATAKKEWKRVMKLLRHRRNIDASDQMALATMCQAYSTMITARKQLAEQDLVFETATGYRQPNPLLAIERNAADLVFRFAREFGLTPASRSKSAVAEVQSDSSWDRISRIQVPSRIVT